MPEIMQLGAQGDGVYGEGDAIGFVPFTLPGEQVTVSGDGKRKTLVTIDNASPDRIDPICEYFGTCGGCQMQHAKPELYQSWKKELAAAALSRVDIDCPIETHFTESNSARRRAVFSVRRIEGKLELGFLERGSSDLVDIGSCPVLIEPLNEAMPQIRAFVSMLPVGKTPARVSVLHTENGLDICIGSIKFPDANLLKALIAKSVEYDFARLSIDDEVLIEKRKPTLSMGIAEVVPNPGGFVQASFEAEETMAEIVSEHLGNCKMVADLFCGVGTFALRLAQKSRIWAIEENAGAIAALDSAWRQTGGKLKQLESEVRNLDIRPVGFQELKKYDGVVFDPPRAGAENQCKQLAKSKVKKIAAVSCNPQTLARDLSILVAGGFSVKSISLVDQFKFTPHIELVALLEK